MPAETKEPAKKANAPATPRIAVSMFPSGDDPNPSTGNLYAIFQGIKDGKWKGIIEPLRKLLVKPSDPHHPSNHEYQAAKKKSPCFTASGSFTYRNIQNLVSHSGIYCVDIDESGVKMAVLREDPHTFCMHKSIGGQGYAVYFKIEAKTAQEHSAYAREITDYIQRRHGIKVDWLPDVTRLRYVSYDPYLYLNTGATPFRITPEGSRDIEAAIQEIEFKKIDLFDGGGYTDQLRICCGLLTSLEEEVAESYFRRLCAVSPKYATYPDAELERRWKEFVKQFKKHENDQDARGQDGRPMFASMGTFWYLARQKGVTVKQGLPAEAEKEVRGLLDKNREAEAIEALQKKYRLPEAKARAYVFRILNEPEAEALTFWSVAIQEKKQETVATLSFLPADLIRWLNNEGFWCYKEEGEKEYRRVRVQENIIREYTTADIQHHTLAYLSGLPFKVDGITRPFLLNEFTKNLRFLFAGQILDTLPVLKPDLLRDSAEASYLAYINGWVRVTAEDSTSIRPYCDLPAMLWEHQIIPRLLPRIVPVSEGFDACHFAVFLSRCGGGNQDRYDSLVSTVGYLLHRYKTPAVPRIVVLEDEVMLDGTVQGGTGKGLIMKAISQVRPTVIEPGKQFDPTKSFAFQLVRPGETAVFCIDDPTRKFRFEDIFNLATEGMKVEKKNRDAIYIPYEQSPKLAITTNYALRGIGPSHRRRKHQVEIAPYYGAERSPQDEFKVVFFTGWDGDQWARFDSFMMFCLACYLSGGLKEVESANRESNALEANTEPGFAQWMDEYLEERMERPIEKKELARAYASDSGHDKPVHQNVWRRWLVAYCSARKMRMEEVRDNRLGPWCYTFKSL